MPTASSAHSRTDAVPDLAQVRAVADLLPQLAWSCLPDGYCDYLSRYWVEYTGVPEAEHHGRGWLEAVHPDDRGRTRDAWDAFVVGKAPYDVAYRLRRHDGAYRWFQTRGVLVRDEAGRPVRVLGTTTDIHAQKRAEERVREIDERSVFVRKASGVGFWYCDLPFDVLEWDERVKEHFHLPPDARVTIDTFFDRIHPDDREPTRAAINRSIADHTPYDVHYRTVHPDTGAVKWVRAIGRTSYAADGTPRQFDGVTLDVTEQRRAADRQQFLADLAAATQPLADPDEVTAVTARLLAEHLGAARCAYAEVEDEAVYVITGDHTRGVPSVVGRWPIAAFGAEHLRAMRANDPYVVHDVDADPRIGPADRPAFRATSVRAVVCVPLLKKGRLTAAMAVHQATPRVWTADEVDLIKTVVGRCWDALQRARAVRLMRQGEEQLRLITDTVPALIAFVGPDRRYQFVNREYEVWFGRPPAEIEGKHLREVVGEAAYERLLPFIDRGLAGERFEFEAFAPYPTGPRHIHASFVPRFDGERVAGYLSLITDVTARVQAQEKLRASEERFRAFMDHSPAAAWITDADGRVQYVSATYVRLFQVPERDLVGSSPSDLYPDEFARAYVRNIRAVADSGHPMETIEQAPRPDGSVGQFLVYKFPLPGGSLVGGVAVDITDRVRAEEQLRDADRRKDEFLALLAHELRNPLAPLRNGLQVMRLAGEHREAIDQARAMMERQLGHLVRLVDDLLDVSRISRNKMELRRERVLLADVVASAVETARPMIDAAGHELTVSLPTEPVYLDADLTRLAQVFANLLTNSAKYTEPGGRIGLTAGRSDGEVVVAVRDTGIGIPADSLRTIFDMFSQVDRSIERSTGGLGIGLALVKGLVEMHGGRVTAASAGPGTGSTFTITLPCEPAGVPTPTSGREGNGSIPAGPGRRILVVDDNRDAAESMAMALELLGHEVRTAHDGLEAVATAEGFRPDLILMDVGMPRLNGYDATRRIREQPWGRGVRVVALTGWGQDGDRAQSRSAGCDGHLVKPVLLEDLLPYMTGPPST